MTVPLVLATRNSGKLRELMPMLAARGFAPLSLVDVGVDESADEDILEVWPSFAENALAKARYFHARCGGRPVLAEDSGLCVDTLGGAPGVRSKRWGADTGASGAALDAVNNARLLASLEGQPDRGASYCCSAALVWTGGERVAEGETFGRILESACGTSGFGYDPVFWSTELGACFGAVSAEEKARVSHRGRAVSALLTGVARSVVASAGPLALD